MTFLWILLGLVLLVGGGDLLVRGASKLALLARVSPTVVGLTIVAAGTSMPELVVSVRAALANSPGLAVGNVVGSNIFNIAAILGIAALIRPLTIHGNSVKIEWPVMMLASFQLYLLTRDGLLDRLEGVFFLVALVVFVAYLLWMAKRHTTASESAELASVAPEVPEAPTPRAWLVNAGLVGVGVGLLIAGASALVHGAVSIARAFEISETIIGLTVVAAGTSLPELSASCVAAWRGQTDIAVANVIGSNIFNILCIGGATACIVPLPVGADVLARDHLWMLAVSLALFPVMITGMRITRLEGGLLFTAFAVYMASLFSVA